MIENLRSLAILAAVVEKGSFRGAGTMLELSASVVSHHISNLEKRLDCPIFYRTSRRLQLTDKGAVLHKAARAMVDVVNGGLSDISEQNDITVGRLRLAIPQVLVSHHLLQTIEGFLAANPKVNLDLHMSAGIVNALNDDFDLIITQCKSIDSTLSTTELTKVSFNFVAAPDLAVKIKRCVLADVPEQIPIILAPGFSHADWETSFSDALGSKVTITSFRLVSDGIAVAHKLACGGAGIVALPNFTTDMDLKSGRLVRVLPELASPEIVFNAVYLSGIVNTSLIGRFLEYILQEQKADPQVIKMLQSA